MKEEEYKEKERSKERNKENILDNHQLSKEELRDRKVTRDEFKNIERIEVYILLDSLKVAHNIGTILRLSDALLIKKVYICGDTIVPPNYKIRRSSRGSEKWVPWEYVEDAKEVIKKLKKEGVEITAVEVTNDSIDYRKYKPSFPICLILGREYDGVSKELLELSDNTIHLPINGMCNSINVSNAASVVMYDTYDKYEKHIDNNYN